MARPEILSMVLAGGEGKRLSPLTRDRAKPAVPFGGIYRLVDFVLSNLANAGFLKIVVLTQYKSHSLDRHIAQTWRMSPLLGNYVAPVPAQMRKGRHWFAGSADAIFQNFNLIHDEQPDYLIVFGADHIYRMDPRQMVDDHIESGAGVSVAGIRVPREEADQFGVIDADRDGRILDFLEKPADPPGLPDAPNQAFASMGNYVFTTSTLMEVLAADAEDEDSGHDLGGDIIPRLVAAGTANVYDFTNNDVPGATDRDQAYWRDVGTLDAYYDAHMDLISVHPYFNLYNHHWPIFTWNPPAPPAKFVFDTSERRGSATDTMVSSGAVISGGTVRHSVISPGVRVHSYSEVDDSVLLGGVEIGRHAVVRNAIIDKNVKVPPGARIGVDEDHDEKRFMLSSEGRVVIGKGDEVPAP